MALSIVVRLREGRYDAGGLDPGMPEWPPHPARLFCALVASAVDPADRDALRWLETLPAPQVWASADIVTSRTKGYVVVNAVEGNGSQTWPGRTNGLRQRVSALPADNDFAVVWPDADPNDPILARLVRLAARVPYVGRSTSAAEVSVLAESVAKRPAWTHYVPVPLGTPDAITLRVPFGGYLHALDDAWDAGIRAWQAAARNVDYASPKPTATNNGAVDGLYSDLLVWGFQQPTVAIGGDDLLTVTQSLRRAVMSCVGDLAPTEVNGHGADGIPHLAYLGLIDAQHENADGHLLGVAVAIPTHLAGAGRRTVLRSLLGPGAASPMTALNAARGRRLRLVYRPDAPWGARPDRWVPRDGSRAWVTVTPLMLDRHLKRNSDVTEEIVRSVINAGFPAPASVELLSRPAVKGGIERFRPGTLPVWAKRLNVHCRIVFEHALRGPVLAGSLRYLGGGLFAPESDPSSENDGAER
jgi:CRISPR-associated protein Csb2